MASGIKGITVEIGGDTTKLGKAISEVSTKSKGLQKELKGINSLLKFDPSNVTLLKQKQDVLNKSIATTKDQLKILKDAQKDVTALYERGEIDDGQYRNFQRDIEAAEQRLKKLTIESKNFGSVGAQQIKLVGEKMQDAGSKVESVGRKFSAISATTGAVLGGATVLASNFQDSMAKVNTIADTSQVSLEDLSAQILDLSNKTGIGADEIANATYDAISAGQNTADAVNFVSNATSLAKAGFADTGASIDLLTTILNAYGMEAGEVSRVSDILINTQNRGKTTVAELSSSMGKIIPTANSMNVSLEQISAGYSIMTAKGIATAESTTYMNSMLNELGKSGTDVSDALKEKTGKSFQDLMAEGNSLGDVLQILSDYASEAGVGFNDLWGSSEAGKAGITLLSDGVESFNDEVKSMSDAVGSTSDALGKLETPSQKAKVAINQIKNSGVELGDAVLTAITPLIDKLAKKIEDLTTWFNNLSPEMKQTIVVVLGVVTALGPLIVIIGRLIGSIGTILTHAPKIVSAVKGIGTVLKGIMSPTTLVIGAIGLLVGAFLTLWKTNEDFRNKVIAIWDGIKAKFESFAQGIVDRLNALGFDFENISEVVKAIWEGLCNFFAPIFEGVFNYISIVLSTVLDVITGILDVFIGLITGNWDQFLTGIKEIFIAIWNGIKSWFTNILDTLKGVADVFLGWFGTNWTNVWNSIKSFFEGIWNGVKTFFTTAVNDIKNVATTVFTAIKTTITNIWNGIKNTITSVINAIKTVITSVWNGIKSITSTVWNAIKTAITTAIETAKNIVSSVVNGIKSIVSGVWDSIKSTTSSVWESIKSAITNPIEAAKNAVKSAIDKMKSFFDFSWELPRIKLPHFNIDGEFSLKPPSVPHFSVDWYKNGAIFSRPTLFNTPFGLKGVGEAGPEAVAPISELMGYVSTAVNNSDIADRISRVENVLKKYLPHIAGGKQIVLDTGVLVGETIDKIDALLNDNQILKERGV